MLTSYLQIFPYRRSPAARPNSECASLATLREAHLLTPVPVETEPASRRQPRPEHDSTGSVSPIIRAQSELVGAMLKAMIVAAGDRVDERSVPRRPTL